MRKDIQGNFCPKCGKPSETGGLCSDCRIGSTPWFTCDTRVQSTNCPSCGAIKIVNTWTDSEIERAALAPDVARSAVHFHPDVKKPSIGVTIRDMTINRSRATLVIRGLLYNKPVEGTCTTEILWHKEQCDRCNRISGSYYEGVVQVRAEGRILSTYEIQIASSIAQQTEDTLQSGGERLSFISDMNEIHDGLDIIVGSQHIGLLISQAIVGRLGGRYTTHPKLVGEKNGRQLYRITYSVRLPRYKKDDVVRIRNRYYEILHVESHHIEALDLKDGTAKTIREDDIEKLIGNSRNAEQALVVFADGKNMGIMDPVSSETREYPQKKWRDIRSGDQIPFLRDGDLMVFVR